MEPTHHKAKITIELEDGTKAEFVSLMPVFKSIEEPWNYPDHLSDKRWNGVQLPEPPRWEFRGTSVGDITVTIR
jgi:hypothetical protein